MIGQLEKKCYNENTKFPSGSIYITFHVYNYTVYVTNLQFSLIYYFSRLRTVGSATGEILQRYAMHSFYHIYLGLHNHEAQYQNINLPFDKLAYTFFFWYFCCNSYLLPECKIPRFFVFYTIKHMIFPKKNLSKHFKPNPKSGIKFQLQA